MATVPAYAAVPRSLDLALISTGNTARDGTGTIVTICTGATNGTRVSSVSAKGTGTTTAGMVRLFLSTDSGSTWRLYQELPVSAITVSASQPSWRGVARFDDLVLTGTSDLIGASTHNSETFHVAVSAMDL